MLLTLGVSHKTAPIEVREKLAFSRDSLPYALKALTTHLALDEAALLSTCNRTELYCSLNRVSETLVESLTGWWQEFCRASMDMRPFLYLFSEEKAVQHLMRVASGLDSMIIGEPQILGQLKNAVAVAKETGVVGKKLNSLFQRSFSTAKRVRTHTEIATHPVSVAYAAVTLAKQIFSDLSKATVVLIGAGENIELTLAHLESKQVKKIIVLNRTLLHAKNLAERFATQYQPLENLAPCLAEADIVISSISCQRPILTEKEMNAAFKGRKRRPVFIVDLGVPRNVDSNIGANEDIYLYTVDDLNGIITENLKNRQRAALEAESIILSASQDYMTWSKALPQIQKISHLRHKAHRIKQETLENALRQLERGGDPKDIMNQFAHRLTQKLMHEPTIMLRKACHQNAQDELKLAKELFNVE